MPTEIKFGMGKVQGLPLELQISPDLSTANRLMLITDKGVAGAGLAAKVTTAFEGSDFQICAVFDEVPPESDSDIVKQIAALAIRHEIQLFIALGGGSVIDTAKAASVIATYGGDPQDYEGGFMVPGPIKPLVVIPTTVGTGSEVTLAALVKDTVTHRKVLISSPFLYPRMAVLDPEMVATLPAKLVAWTGMDTLTHAIEAYTCSEHEPITEGLALRAIEMVADNLQAATEESGPTEARAKMQIAACIAGMAFSNSPVGAVHAVAHAAGGLYGVHHGLANAIALPNVMEFNLEFSAPGYAAIGRAMGVLPEGSIEDQARAAISAVRELRARVGVVSQYRDAGVPATQEAIEKITDLALEDLCFVFNPRKGSREEILGLVRQMV